MRPIAAQDRSYSGRVMSGVSGIGCEAVLNEQRGAGGGFYGGSRDFGNLRWNLNWCGDRNRIMTAFPIFYWIEPSSPSKRIPKRLLDSQNTWEVFRALKATLEGFEQEIKRLEALGMRFAIFRNRKNVGADEFERGGAREIRIVPVVGGNKRGGTLQTVLGAVLIAIAYFNPFGYFSGPAVSAMYAAGAATLLVA